MPKPITKISSRKEEIDGKIQTIYTKQCPYCHKQYETTSRSQKFCNPDCCKKYNKRQKVSKERYNKIKTVERIRVRSHSLAVAVLEELDSMGVRKKVCSNCGSLENLQVHHIRKFNWLDNTPDNLMWLCESCHAAEHSRIEKELNEKGILLTEWYENSMVDFYEALNKNSKK